VSLRYRIGEIGWYNFETLTQTLLKAVIGPGVTSFGGSKDHGRDASFNGESSFPTKESRWSGYWIFQVKYVDFADRGIAAAQSHLKSALRAEMDNILRRHRARPDNYVLVTDVPLTGQSRDVLSSVVQEAGFTGNFHSVDGREVCEFLDIFPDIRRSYPQLLGLSDLAHIFNREVYVRSEAYFAEWQPRLAVFVQTDAYFEALKVLRKHHFVVLDGPPETGKTMIAAAASLLHATEGFEVLTVKGPSQFLSLLDKTKPQLFVADDAIGSIELDPSLVDDWSRDLPGILKKLDKTHRLIWTARHYILEEALSESRLGDVLPPSFPSPHQVLVEVGTLTAMQRAEILYNHAKRARLSSKARSLIREHAREIAKHANFTPERIRQLVELVLTPENDAEIDCNVTWSDIENFLSNPGQRWIRAYNSLSKSEQALLVAMLDFSGSIGVTGLKRAYEARLPQMQNSGLKFKDALARLSHSFLHLSKSYGGEEEVDFQHPSLRDMLLSQLREDEWSRRKYIELTSATGLASLIRGLAVTAD
jgi:hypothetical protein